MFSPPMLPRGSWVMVTSPSSGRLMVYHTSCTYFDTEPVLLVPLSQYCCAMTQRGLSSRSIVASKCFVFM